MRSYEKNRVPHIIFGNNSIEVVGKKLADFGVKNCLVVTDAGIAKLGMADRVIKLVEAEGIKCDLYDRCQPEPPDYTCLQVRELIMANKYDGVIGLGGGSSMDTAKVGCIMAGVEGEIKELHDYSKQGTLMKESYRRPAVLITIPTTSGTGAECTITGVISSTSLNLKFSIGNENTIPDMAIVDPLLTVGMPPRPTVCCGIDILGHSVEMAIGVGQNEYTRLIVLDCIERAWKWLPIAVKEPQNVEAREQLSWAAHNALCNGGAANGHAAAHAVGALYHIVHGHAVAIVLPALIRHFAQSDKAAESIRAIAGKIGVPVIGDRLVDGNRVADAFLDYYKRLGLKPLRQAMEENGFHDDRETFVKKAVPITLDDFKSRLWTPPIHESKADVEKVLGMIYDEE